MKANHKAILREALRREFTRANGKSMVSQAQIDAYLDAAMDDGSALSPEEQIKRNPALALDTPEPRSYSEAVAELLRWFHRPEEARGKTICVPHGHPSGLGGHTVYIPKRPRLSSVQPCQPDTHPTDQARRTCPQSGGQADLA